MFLFTTPPASTRETGLGRDAGTRNGATTGTPAGSASAGVVDAIRSGARSTGTEFDYLLATAKRESSLDPSAKAATSSATGLFQFIEQTWLGTMKNAGPKLGLSAYADAITARPDGTYTVQDASARQTILDLRRDPAVAATMAGALTQRNGEALTAALGREPTSGDLYAAHVLGARGAATLIGTAQASPARAAALDMPEAAAANRSLFYDKTGRPRGAAELYALLSTSQSASRPAPTALAGAPIEPASTADPVSAYAAIDGGGLRALFQTDKRQGAMSEGVARLWQGRAASPPASSPQPTRSAPTYFPRSDGTGETASTTAAIPVEPAKVAATASLAAAPATALVGAPLPPRRPAEFSAAASRQAGTVASKPLDLSLFATRSGQ
ncbi:lytic transglycosylase [Methylobacterium sp. Leaf106]|uniref:lytic transglycosylase n=1 Tax=Methylobacterium sp. Leaf106 TaxID=1736255 RepID=UPI0006F8CC3A|nr:lytic transglycosylase [Methylobacterium sp. Leaf106]KQP37746.1 lytic transglycosylase [Methylobacterium sp. Leaf106]